MRGPQSHEENDLDLDETQNGENPQLEAGGFRKSQEAVSQRLDLIGLT